MMAKFVRVSFKTVCIAALLAACSSAPRGTEATQSAQAAPPAEPGPETKHTDFTAKLSAPRAVDGAIVLFTLHPAGEIKADTVKVKFEGAEFPVFRMDETSNVLQAVVTIPFNSKPRQSKVEFTVDARPFSLPIEVVDGKYSSETLKVDQKHVSPPKKVLKRILAEQKEIGALYRQVTRVKLWSGPFALPIGTETTSPFGNKRVYNGEMKSFHQGQDFRARTPLPVYAPEAAKIVLAKDLYFTGWTVILDHGYGIFTIYGHMSKLAVKLGEPVKKGQELGLTGATGRASGPHLHWGAVNQRAKFNPLDLTRVLR